MKKHYQVALSIMITAFYIGCNKVSFTKDESIDACQNSAISCVKVSGFDQFNYKVQVDGGNVDILIINDNSGSMSFEQNNMAERFGNFIQALEAKYINYRIGIITTDVSATKDNGPRAINQNGALQDGKLIQLENGEYFMTQNSKPSLAEREALFAKAIQRPETKICENFLTNNPTTSQGSSQYLQKCPSGDERGIYAANLFVTQNPHSFIRTNAHLAMVFLSDEDVRSSKYSLSNSMVLDNLDLPSTLVEKVKSLYANKTLSVHTIIVKPGELKKSILEVNNALADLTYDPVNAGYDSSIYFSTGDTNCLNAQYNQIPNTYISGSEGFLYSLLAEMTGGIKGDICANDYGSQLSNMGNNISDRTNEIQLACANPVDLSVLVNSINSSNYKVNNGALKFNESLRVGTEVSLSYKCASMN